MKPKSKEEMLESRDLSSGFNYGNALDIPKEVQDELDSKGYVARWLNAKKLSENQGYHRSGWQVFHSEVAKQYATIDLKRGTTPDGVIRRQDCVLGYKPKSANEAQKKELKRRAAAQQKSARYKLES